MLIYTMILLFHFKTIVLVMSFLEFVFKWFVDYLTTLNEVHAKFLTASHYEVSDLNISWL